MATKKEIKEVAVVEEVKGKKNKKKENAPVIVVMDNDTLRKLFTDNGCVAKSKATNESKVVYQQFGTKSRILQQGKAYQLLLTNGHAKEKEVIVDTDNDDTARFLQFVDTLTDEEKSHIIGIDTIMATTLSIAEMPRERSCKINNYDLLVKFIQFMAEFDENKILVTEK